MNYATVNGTALPGSDYAARSGTLTFPAGTVTHTIIVPTIADALVEPNESFTVQLSAAGNATHRRRHRVRHHRQRRRTGVPAVSINSIGALRRQRGTPVAAFTVSLSNAPAQDGLVSFRTVAGTATPPADYTSTTGTLTFAGGTIVQTIQVPIVPDLLPEADEVFTVELFDPVNVTLGTASARRRSSTTTRPGGR